MVSTHASIAASSAMSTHWARALPFSARIITRQDPDHAFAGQGWDAEKLSITQAIRLFTIDGARALGLQERTGTLEVGKSADLIVLNHNLLEIPAEQINETQVQMTFFEGELVYTGKDA